MADIHHLVAASLLLGCLACEGAPPVDERTSADIAYAPCVEPDCGGPFGIDVEMIWGAPDAPQIELVQDTGTGWVRLVLFWSGFEPNPPTGEPSDQMGRKTGDHTYDWNWAGFEDLVNALHAQGKQIVFTQLFNPIWTNGAPESCLTGATGCGFFCDPECANAPTNPLWYEDYIYNLVTHFGDRVKFYSMANEPNLRIFYNPKPPYVGNSIFAQFIADYAEPFERALTAADADAQSFGPELSRNDAQLSWQSWWNAMIGDYPQYWDVISQHYYEKNSRATRDQIDSEVMPSLQAHGLLGVRPFWVTELGYDSCRGDQYQSDQIYGSHIDMFNRSAWWKRIFVHALEDGPGHSCGHGMAHEDRSRKPSFYRYQQLTGVTPAISAAGRGCDDGYCIWITGSQFNADSYVDVRIPGQQPIVASYRDDQVNRDLAGNPQGISVRLDPELWDELDTTGVNVWVVNPEYGTWSNSALVR